MCPSRNGFRLLGGLVGIALIGCCLLSGCTSLERKYIFPGSVSQGRAAVSPDATSELVNLEPRGGPRCVGRFGKALDSQGRVAADSEDRPTVIFFYGNGMCLADAAPQFETFRRLGANVFVPEFPGYGMSEGQPSEAAFYALADAAYAHVSQRRDVDVRRIIVCGWSLGAALAVHVATQQDVRGLVAISAFTSMPAVERKLVPWLPLSWFLRPRFDNLTRMPNLTCPISLVHGGKDRLVPVAMAEQLASAAKTRARLVRVADAGHNDIFDVGATELAHALREYLGQPVTPRS